MDSSHNRLVLLLIAEYKDILFIFIGLVHFYKTIQDAFWRIAVIQAHSADTGTNLHIGKSLSAPALSCFSCRSCP